MRYLFRLAGLAIILWLHHPLLASLATSAVDKAIPLRERDRIGGATAEVLHASLRHSTRIH